jgi:SagB-type dehydrogenase family enzyme
MKRFFSADQGESTGMRFFESTKRRKLESGCAIEAPANLAATGMNEIATPTHARLSLLNTLHARCTFREFSTSTLNAQQLRAAIGMLSEQLGADSTRAQGQRYKRPHRPGGLLAYVRVDVLVANVEELAPGIYEYDFAGNVLNMRRPVQIRQFLSESLIQPETIDTPAALVLVGQLANCLQDHGDRGYRYMLFEIGMLMQKFYLGLASLGLGGAPNGSIIHRNFDSLLQLDGYEETSINVFAFGQPAN